MATAKPTLGYPTRTDAAIALRAKGMDDRTIAKNLGIQTKNVSALISSRKNLKRPTNNQHTMALDSEILAALRPAAIRRGISVNKLCRDLLATIADDDLANAILDDALELAQ